ncbi:MAG: MBOAT family protein [Nitrosarchaeum sp.]|nr:MBOAT family protein [Nitrosarchaeum sp.]
MLFNTIDFLLFFVLVITFIGVIKSRKFQHIFLLTASYFFFYYTSNYLIILLIFSTLVDFFIGKQIWKAEKIQHKKILLILSLTVNLGLLGFYKYADFAILQFNILGNHLNLNSEIPLLDLILPIGISFYTFQTISYTVDIYRGKLKPSKSFKEFALFVTFFPQLVAGPILRASEFLPQLREKIDAFETHGKIRQIILENSNLKLGLTLMVIGFFKKMFFADNIAPLVNEIFSNPFGLDSLTIILGTIGFGLQIYADFSAYTDIAIGAALMLGFKLPVNFNLPYFATSPSDFWRRWHISLSSWLRDYLYIPLGGNKKSKIQTYGNILVVMILGGLWHGASVNFIIWGALHGVYLAIHKILIDKFPRLKNNPFFNSKLGKIVSIFITQYFIFLAWIAFYVKDTDAMIYSFKKYIIFDFEILDGLEFIYLHKLTVAIMGLFIILNLISYKKNIKYSISNLPMKYWIFALAIPISLILLFYDSTPNDFIYFQF